MDRTHLLAQIGQKAVLIRDGKCLILEVSHMPGMYDLPGGRIEVAESRDEAFRREVKEELGLNDFEILGVIDYELWLRQGKTTICLIAQLIANESDPITISDEHQSYAWVSPKELDAYAFVEPAMKRMVQKGFEYSTLLSYGK